MVYGHSPGDTALIVRRCPVGMEDAKPRREEVKVAQQCSVAPAFQSPIGELKLPGFAFNLLDAWEFVESRCPADTFGEDLQWIQYEDL